jgi:hypothetical protein
MTGGEREDVDDHRKRDEANIRWLLAAVLHHEVPAPSADEEE